MLNHFWGWQVVLDMFLGGIAAGVMIVSVITAGKGRSRSFRLFPLIAPVAISIALAALLFDLENKLHAFRFFTAFRVTSPMSWGSWILLAIFPATLLYVLARLEEEETARLPRGVVRLAAWAKTRVRAIARANLVLGILLGSYTGALLTASARPAWASITIAPLFLASAVVSGAALCKLVSLRSDEHACVCRCLVGAMFAELAMLLAYFADLKTTRALFFGGPYTAAMWSLVIIAGLAVPALMQTLELRGRARPAAIAPVLILAGALVLRWILLAAGQVSHV